MASIGYAASLGQQELLVRLTPRELSGHVLGAESAGRITCQGLAAALAGAIAGAIAEGIPTAGAIALLALGSLLVSVLLTPALRRAAVEAPIAGTLAGHPTL